LTDWYRKGGAMTQVQQVLNIINWGINVAFIVTLLFPIGVRPFWNWMTSDWGWNIVTFDSIVALALLPTWLHHTLGINASTLLFLYIEAVSIWSVPIVVLWRAWIIYNAQRHVDMQKEEDDAVSRSERVSDDSEYTGD
jgi:hypothetical protein